jgi:hypothetical protein
VVDAAKNPSETLLHEAECAKGQLAFKESNREDSQDGEGTERTWMMLDAPSGPMEPGGYRARGALTSRRVADDCTLVIGPPPVL